MRHHSFNFRWVMRSLLCSVGHASLILVKSFTQSSTCLDCYGQVDLTETIFANILYSRRWGKLIYVLIEILFWSLIAGILQHMRIFWKL